jgi:hypothetical protein
MLLHEPNVVSHATPQSILFPAYLNFAQYSITVWQNVLHNTLTLRVKELDKRASKWHTVLWHLDLCQWLPNLRGTVNLLRTFCSAAGNRAYTFPEFRSFIFNLPLLNIQSPSLYPALNKGYSTEITLNPVNKGEA